ncbi:MAG: phosphatidate cytidylyltransferase [Paraglaciecola sp.]|jgi:phosphatidate cytidylyltransferase
MKILQENISPEVQQSLQVLFGLLSLCLAVFFMLKKNKPSPLNEELFIHTHSWAFMSVFLVILVICQTWIGSILLTFLSFLALREMLSICKFRTADKPAMLVAYCCIPLQYFLIENQMNTYILTALPIAMFMLIPTVLVFSGSTEKIGQSMALIPTLVMLTVFFSSHLAMLFNLEFSTFQAGNGILILFLVALTALNDVFQFTWGKLLSKRKIMPLVSPNKT